MFHHDVYHRQNYCSYSSTDVVSMLWPKLLQVASVAAHPVSAVVAVLWLKLLGVLPLLWVVSPLWIVPPLLVVPSLAHWLLISSCDISSQKKEGMKVSIPSLKICQVCFQATNLTLLVLIFLLWALNFLWSPPLTLVSPSLTLISPSTPMC